jgi:hypothetical protein
MVRVVVQAAVLHDQEACLRAAALVVRMRLARRE